MTGVFLCLHVNYESLKVHNHGYRIFCPQFGSPGEPIAVEIDALDELMHNTSAFLQVKVE